jgi:copper chaperone CopZ
VRHAHDLLNSLALVGLVVALAIVGPWVFGQLRSLPRAHTLAARADQRIVTLEVGGMTCGGCASAVEGKLAAVPGVSGVTVRFPQRRAYVVCEPSVADTALTEAVHRAGPGFLAAVTQK